MDNVSAQSKDGSKAIVTAQHYSQEMQAIRKSPALPPMSEFDLQRADEMSKTLIRSEDRLDDIVVFGSEAQATLASITKDMLRGVRVGSLDEVIQLSDGVLAQIHTLDINDLSPRARKLLLGINESARAIKNRIENFFRKYEMVNSRLDRQEAEHLCQRNSLDRTLLQRRRARQGGAGDIAGCTAQAHGNQDFPGWGVWLCRVGTPPAIGPRGTRSSQQGESLPGLCDHRCGRSLCQIYRAPGGKGGGAAAGDPLHLPDERHGPYDG